MPLQRSDQTVIGCDIVFSLREPALSCGCEEVSGSHVVSHWAHCHVARNEMELPFLSSQLLY